MSDPVSLVAAAGSTLSKLKAAAENPCLSWLFFRKLKQCAFKNQIVGEHMAQIEAADEIARLLEQKDLNQRAPQEITETLDNVLPLNKHFSAPTGQRHTRDTRVIQNFLHDQSWQQTNRDTIAFFAHETLINSGFMDTDEAKDQDAANRLDEDFMARFYRYAGDISKEEAQQLWAKLLADEVQRPGSFSVYALEVLRSMTKQDLEYMNLLSGLMFGNKLLAPVELHTITVDGKEIKKTMQLDTFSFSPSRAPDAGEGMYRPAFERLKQLGLCSGLADSAAIQLHEGNCTQIMLRNGTISLHLQPGRTFQVDIIDAHSAFFELATLWEAEPLPADGIILLCIALETYNILYLFDFTDTYRINSTVFDAESLDFVSLNLRETSQHSVGHNYQPRRDSLAGYLRFNTPNNAPNADALNQLVFDLNDCETITEAIEVIRAAFCEDRGEMAEA